MLNQEQKELLFRLALKELGLEVEKCNLFMYILEEKGFLLPHYTIGRFRIHEQKYEMYGMPKTNQKVINLMKDTLELEIKEIEYASDKTSKYEPFHHYR